MYNLLINNALQKVAFSENIEIPKCNFFYFLFHYNFAISSLPKIKIFNV